MAEYRQATWEEPLILEYRARGPGYVVSGPDEDIARRVGEYRLPRSRAYRESAPRIPALSEPELIRHYTRLSQMSYGVDSGPVPLGSCTMKYNPRIALRYSYDQRVRALHPLQDDETVQGLLEVMHELQEWLKNILGMDACSLHPAAGAHGELAGVLMIRKYHELRGSTGKDEIIVPDSAHGTNPASAAMAGFRVIEVPTGSDGNIDWDSFKAAVGERTAGLMITNPSTLGLFEERILDIAREIHGVDGLLYYDGANLNGILGHARPGDMGFDIAHVNLHKTFSSPHGGGGPGAGPVCVRDRPVSGGARLPDLLPGPVVVREGRRYKLKWPGEKSVGLLRAFQANTLVLVWAYVYMLSLGARGLRLAGEVSVLNTNYFARKLLSLSKGGYSMPYGESRPRKHEVVISCERLREETGITAEDVAKALLDSGLHAPTIYFPLIVREALMFEFTESEPKEVIDAYIERLLEIEETARRDPEKLRKAPTRTSRSRIDTVTANHPRTVTPTWRVERLRKEGVLGPLR